MASIRDWATKAATYIHNSYRHGNPSVDSTAAVIATYADPLVSLLRESRREHRHCDDSFYCCPRCNYVNGHGLNEGDVLNPDLPCDCSADEWNAKVDKALSGL